LDTVQLSSVKPFGRIAVNSHTDQNQNVVGLAAGVPFVALPPAGGARPDAPVIVAWHLMDPPRSEAAFAAAVPLAGLDAWRVYLGLPMSGERLPAGGWDEVFRLASEDAVRKMHQPVVEGAAEEFAPAWASLRDQLGIEAAQPVGVMGGSSGAAVAQLVLAEHLLDAMAAVLISPVVRLRAAVDAIGRRFGITYPWDDETGATAERLDFVARAPEIAERHSRLAALVVVGELDDRAGFLDPAADLEAAAAGRVEVTTIAGMGHAIAEEPGMEPAPQTADAKAVDRAAVRWFRNHLGAAG
jgi:pimeloyl-ACP methyl ester carboxylesterase